MIVRFRFGGSRQLDRHYSSEPARLRADSRTASLAASPTFQVGADVASYTDPWERHFVAIQIGDRFCEAVIQFQYRHGRSCRPDPPIQVRQVFREWLQHLQLHLEPDKKNLDWHVYGGQPRRAIEYSLSRQINRDNTFPSLGLRGKATIPGEQGALQTQPLIAGRTMFVYTPSQKIIALDAASGKQLWQFDSGIASGQPDRGFAYWTDGKQKMPLFARNHSMLCGRFDPDSGESRSPLSAGKA